MSAFLKIDRCKACGRDTPWEWVPPILLLGKPMAGTGVWRSTLTEGRCAPCHQVIESERYQARHAERLRERLIRLLGGVKPFREFTLERYKVTPGNQSASALVKAFNPAKDNLYLWGLPGVGKTHLAYAAARRAFCQDRSAEITTLPRLIRKLRMKPPDEEQHLIDGFVCADVLVLDDLGIGHDTVYARQVLREILDARSYRDRGGLIVTSLYPLSALAVRLSDRAIPSRLAGMCRVVEIRESDSRGGASETR
jgi:DNA replication protein DnaC